MKVGDRVRLKSNRVLGVPYKGVFAGMVGTYCGKRDICSHGDMVPGSAVSLDGFTNGHDCSGLNDGTSGLYFF
jgi:hypothetical protein